MASPVDDIVSVDDVPKHLITNLYGPEGVGKTILASRLGDNNLIVATERSNVSLSNFPELRGKTRILKLKTFDRFTALLRQLYNGEVEADHVIVDTFPALVDLKLGEQLQKVQFNRKHPDVNSLEDFQLLKEHFKTPLRQVAKLDISFTFISHDRVPDEKSYEKGDKLIRPNVPFAVHRLLNGYTNITAYMHRGKDGRALLLESSRTHVAKTHIDMGSAVVSDDKFVEVIRNWKGI